MKKLLYFLTVSLVVLSFSVPSHAAGINDFSGTWNNADRATKGVTKLEISVKGSSASVHAWGKCHPQDCDWGSVPARYYKDGTLRATYRTKIAVRSLIFKMKNRNAMTANIKTHYIDKSGRPDQSSVETFNRSGASGAIQPGSLSPTGKPASTGATASGTTKPTGKEKIILRYPNGGEELVAGQEYIIKWNTTGIVDKVTIALLMENLILKATGKRIPPMPVYYIARQVKNTGSYSFKIPYKFNSRFGQVYYIQVSSDSVTGRSNTYFKIYPLIDVAPTNIKVYSYEKKKKHNWFLRTVAAVATGGQSEITHMAVDVAKSKLKITKRTRIKIKFDLTNYGTKILREKFMTKVRVLVRPGNDELNSAGFSHDAIIPILPGKLYHYEADIKPSDWNILPGNYRLELHTDPGHILTEPDELRKNNIKIVDFQVGK